jgi:hypothetical protein
MKEPCGEGVASHSDSRVMRVLQVRMHQPLAPVALGNWRPYRKGGQGKAKPLCEGERNGPPRKAGPTKASWFAARSGTAGPFAGGNCSASCCPG